MSTHDDLITRLEEYALDWRIRAASKDIVDEAVAALRAAASTGTEAAGVKVKPLEWTDNSANGMTMRHALSHIGEYLVGRADDGTWYWALGYGGSTLYFATEDAAKAAAQADYEQHILSALASSERSGREAVDLAEIERVARKVNPGRSEDHIKSVALDCLSIIRNLAGTNTK